MAIIDMGIVTKPMAPTFIENKKGIVERGSVNALRAVVIMAANERQIIVSLNLWYLSKIMPIMKLPTTPDMINILPKAAFEAGE